jgi:hypothetical protein
MAFIVDLSAPPAHRLYAASGAEPPGAGLSGGGGAARAEGRRAAAARESARAGRGPRRTVDRIRLLPARHGLWRSIKQGTRPSSALIHCGTHLPGRPEQRRDRTVRDRVSTASRYKVQRNDKSTRARDRQPSSATARRVTCVSFGVLRARALQVTGSDLRSCSQIRLLRVLLTSVSRQRTPSVLGLDDETLFVGAQPRLSARGSPEEAIRDRRKCFVRQAR